MQPRLCVVVRAGGGTRRRARCGGAAARRGARDAARLSGLGAGTAGDVPPPARPTPPAATDLRPGPLPVRWRHERGRSGLGRSVRSVRESTLPLVAAPDDGGGHVGRHAGRAAGRAVGQSALVALRRLLAVWRRGEGVPPPRSAGEIARRTRDGWVWGIDQTVEEGQAAGGPGPLRGWRRHLPHGRRGRRSGGAQDRRDRGRGAPPAALAHALPTAVPTGL